MNKAALARANFNSFDVAGFFERDAENEVPIDVAAAGGNFEGRISAKNQIWLAKLPTRVEFWDGRKAGGRAFGHFGFDPFLEKRYFIWREMQVVVQLKFAGFGKPRGHDVLLCEVGNL